MAFHQAIARTAKTQAGAPQNFGPPSFGQFPIQALQNQGTAPAFQDQRIVQSGQQGQQGFQPSQFSQQGQGNIQDFLARLFTQQPTSQAAPGPGPSANAPTGQSPSGDPGLTRGEIDFSDFLNIPGGPTRDDFLARNLPALNTGQRTTKERLAQSFADAFGGFGPASSQATPLALSTLNELLFGQGQTSPLLLNQQLSNIDRTAESQQTDLQGQLAQLGLQNSGVAQAISASVGQAGADRRAGAIAEETRLTEERKRQDLELFNRLIQDPALQAAAIQLGVPKDTSPSTGDALIGAGASLLKFLL